MKRLCIFVIYDKEKIVDSYIRFLLKSLKDVTSKLIVVCNFDEVKAGIENIIADDIYYRENIGFDAGAYQYIICNKLGWDELLQYDELLLANDTYFGPFYPLHNMFDTMSCIDCDFWGITRHPGGSINNDIQFPSHIQSYFILFRRKLLCSKEFRIFWEGLPESYSVQETINNFEIGMSVAFENNGFKGLSYMDIKSYNFKLEKDDNPYLKFPLELIRDCKIPFLKKRCLYFDNDWYCNGIDALLYIKENFKCNQLMIEEYFMRMNKIQNGIPKFDLCAMEQFVRNFSKVYIYGNGNWAKKIDKYFSYKNWGSVQHLVSSKCQDEDVILFDDVTIRSDEGIIIAISDKKIVEDILIKVSNKCCEKQLLYPLF